MTKPYTRRSSTQWQQIVDDQAQSGLSAPQYCQKHHVSYASFCQWRQRFSQAKALSDDPHSDFIDLSQIPTFSGSGRWNISLSLGDGVELRLSRD